MKQWKTRKTQSRKKEIKIMDDPKQQILTRKKLKELLEQVDPHEAMEAEVENLLLDLSDDFICNVTRSACQMARHRQSEQLEIKDLQLVLGIPFLALTLAGYLEIIIGLSMCRE
eukprot:Partr_v1_DN28350_c1_g1_i2_m79263 putative TAF12 RNA polymerase II, TATA box binding protein (TBP)-associated factor